MVKFNSRTLTSMTNQCLPWPPPPRPPVHTTADTQENPGQWGMSVWGCEDRCRLKTVYQEVPVPSFFISKPPDSTQSKEPDTHTFLPPSPAHCPQASLFLVRNPLRSPRSTRMQSA